MHEQKFGLIELDSCDFKTDLNKHYYCDLAEGDRNYVLKEVRDAYIAQEVLNSEKDKIIMLYGKAHYNPLRKKLKSEGYRRK